MQELLNFLIEINKNTKYTAALRYLPRKIKGTFHMDYAVDIMLGDQNLYHRHSTDESNISSIIKEIKEVMKTQSTYYVQYSDGFMDINYKATGLKDAQIKSMDFNQKYGIECEITEILNENLQ